MLRGMVIERPPVLGIAVSIPCVQDNVMIRSYKSSEWGWVAMRVNIKKIIVH